MQFNTKTTSYIFEENRLDKSLFDVNGIKKRIVNRKGINGKVKTYAAMIYFVLLTVGIIITLL